MREMKDSGVEWIGEIPKEWKMGFIKNGYKIILGKMLSPTQTQSNQSLENYISAINIKWNGVDTSTQKQMWFSKDEKKEYLLKSGDILITEGGLAGTSCKYNNEFAPCYIQNSVHCCRAKKGYINKFLYYWMNIVVHCGFINSICNKATIVHYTKEKVMNTPFIIVPDEKQKTIAEFLDQKCSEIDAITNDIQAQIDTLEQYKRSVITEAVTKGLDPDVEMKDSGIEWIGKIPNTWELLKAKYCVNITNGSDPKTDGNIPVYGSGATSFKSCGEYKDGPAVLIGRKGATLHIPHYVENRYWNVDTAFDVKAKQGFSLRYYYYLAVVFDYGYYLSQTTLPSMTQSNYNSMKIPFPPSECQDKIVCYIDNKCKSINAIITEKQSQLSILSDYKKSLIYEYVTGKKEVPVE